MEDINEPLVKERSLLKFCFDREHIRNIISPLISPEWFYDTGLRKVVKAIAKFISDYGEFPTKSDVKLIIDGDVDATNAFDKVLSMDVSQYTDEYLIDEIESYIRQKLLSDASMGLAEASSTGEDDSEIDKWIERVENARLFSFTKLNGLNVFTDTDKLWDEIHSEHSFVKTNIHALDSAMKGGLAKGHTTVFFAESGFGKTTIMGAIAVNTALQGAKTLYITMELSKGYLGSRIIQSALGISGEELYKLDKTQLRNRVITGIYEQCRTNLYIEEIVPGSSTYQVKKIIRDYFNRGIKFDLVVIDYLQLLSPTRKINGNNSNELMKWVTIELNAYAKEFDFAHLTAAQVNRSGYDRSDFGMDAVAEGISIAQNVSVIWGMMATEEQLSMGHITLKSLKNRFGKKNIRNVVEVSFEKMQIKDIDKSEQLSAEMTVNFNKGIDILKNNNAIGGIRKKLKSIPI